MSTIKKCLYVFIAIVGIGALRPISLPQEGPYNLGLFHVDPSIFRSHSGYDLVQESCVLLDDDFNLGKYNLTSKGFKKFLERFSIPSVKLLSHLIANSHWEIFFDSLKSSHFISLFAFLPLRSPPYFLI